MKKSNAMGVLTILVLIAIVIISYTIMLKPYNMLASALNNNNRCNYVSQETCPIGLCVWDSGVCQALPTEVNKQLAFQKKMWLIAGILFMVSLIIWLIVISTRNDPQEYRIE